MPKPSQFTMRGKREATVQDLYDLEFEGKAEIVNGEILLMGGTQYLPGCAALEVVISLREYARRTKHGHAVPDPVNFIVNLPNRRSFSPDAAFHVGPTERGRFIDGAPIFAVEVRSEGDYGLGAERGMAAKRAEYFAAGTLVVWDVDVLRQECIRVYRATDPQTPSLFHRGETAEAEPAVPGWRFQVNDLFQE